MSPRQTFGGLTGGAKRDACFYTVNHALAKSGKKALQRSRTV